MEVSLINSNKSLISADLNSAKLELVKFLQTAHTATYDLWLKAES